MSWNPYKRIADLEHKVSEMHYELLRMASDHSMRILMLERTKAKEAAAGFVNPPPNLPVGLLTAEEAQRIADKRVRQNAAARKHYAKKKRMEAEATAVQP